MILRSSLSLPFGGRREGAKLSFYHLKNENVMDKKSIWKMVIQTLISILSAIGTTLGITSCM